MSNTAIAINGLLDAEYFDLESIHVKDIFRIFVAKPPFADKERRYPGIYAADGNGAFPLVLSTQRSLAWAGEAPAAYVIGVGYPTEGGYLQAVAKRNRDYPPTDAGDYARAMLGSTFAAGGNAFLRFLIDELKPDLESRYAIDASKITRELTWKPAEQFEGGLRKTVRWYLENGEWVNGVRTGAYREWLTKNYSERAEI